MPDGPTLALARTEGRWEVATGQGDFQAHMRTLYVTADAAEAEAIRRNLALTAPDDTFDICERVRDAYAAMDSLNYDAVLTDCQMPDGDALGLLEHIRGRQLPTAVIVLAREEESHSPFWALRADADDYLVRSHRFLELLPGVMRMGAERRKT